MTAVVVNKRTDDFDVDIGRPGKWGNPFVIGRDGTREEVIAKYEEWLPKQAHLMAALHELRDKRLGCHCKPKPCHGDPLARLVNLTFAPTLPLPLRPCPPRELGQR